jgi:two-component system nitrogen regulation sensor histidine kinase GlnL
MLITQYILMAIIVINTAIGIAIYAANPGRSQNRLLFNFCNILTLWMVAVIGIIYSESSTTAEILIRIASMTATLIPLVLALLHNAIKAPQLTLSELLKTCKIYAICSMAIMVLCMTDFFLIEVQMPTPNSPEGTVAEAKYGPGFPVFAAYFLIMILSAIASSVATMRKSTGLAKAELQYVLLGAGLMLIVSFSLSLLIPLIFKTTQIQQFGPVSVIVMNAILAYGIATRRILDVGTVIRKIVAYTILTVYLIAVYMVMWALIRHVLFRSSPNAELIAQVIAAVVVAFAMAPVHGRFQRVADRLITSLAMDIPATMKQAGVIFQSVSTIDALLQQFSDLLLAALSADDIKILLATESGYTECNVRDIVSERSFIHTNSAVTNLIRETKDTVSNDTLTRLRQTQKVKQVLHELDEMSASVAAGIFSKNQLRGLVLFGQRRGGRIYDKSEQETIQLLCNQFAVALENAQMYTEMQDSKIRNEIMLDQLVSGVILATTDRTITLFNHEAQRITGISEEEAIDKSIDILPGPIRQSLDNALKLEHGERNIDARLFGQDENNKSLSIRMGTTFLLGHDEKAMGSLIVFTDMTELKSLEEQVRRSDQLSSVGTLAAGMAHEIKNPLVTIKTFTQLLPQRYSDQDFREDFSSLVAHEVSRIDGIVNELLSFSKPTKPHLVPMNLHETIDQMLKLTHEQMAQKNISAECRKAAELDTIHGDSKLLSQAMINLTLNAIEAIEKDGTIRIETCNLDYRFANGDDPANPVTRKCIRIQISDTGKGIPQESIQNIFDPFFTNKSEGTGMGLSVAHGIISEHHGIIEVESEIGRGTTFYIYLPALEEMAA